MTKEFKLVLEGMQGVNGVNGVSTEENNDYEYTRLRGGFGSEDSVMISDLQVAKLLEYKKGARQVREQLERKKDNFVVGEHYYDIKEKILGVSGSDTYSETLESLGYTKQALLQAKNIYIFSKSGLLLFLKFAEGEKSIKLYKEFIESYFKMVHELETTSYELEVTNKKLEVVTEALEETTEALQANAISITKEMAMLQVELAYESDENVRLSLLERIQELTQLSIQSNRALEKKKATDELLNQYEPQLTFANTVEQNNVNNFDIGDFAKILNIKGMGRNKMLEWLREQKILMSGVNKNMPYQQHIGNHFKVTYVNTKNNLTVAKTLLTGSGVIYVVKRLIKSGKLNSSVTGKEVLSKLEKQVQSNDSVEE